MSKNALYLVVAFALAATAATFFISGHDKRYSCFMNDVINERVLNGEAVPEGSVPSNYATVRGYPYRYYQDPFPANCVAADSASSLNSLNVNHLGSDFLIWLLVSLAASLGIAGFKAWRGPRMLGDNVRRR